MPTDTPPRSPRSGAGQGGGLQHAPLFGGGVQMCAAALRKAGEWEAPCLSGVGLRPIVNDRPIA
jgi:hypothetical protein